MEYNIKTNMVFIDLKKASYCVNIRNFWEILKGRGKYFVEILKKSYNKIPFSFDL